MLIIKTGRRNLRSKPIIINGEDTGFCVRSDGKVYNSETKKDAKRRKFFDTEYDMVDIPYYSKYKKAYRTKEFFVHRLIAENFVKNDEKGKKTIVNHINGNKTDNDALNLEWVDERANAKHAISTGLWNPYGEKNGNSAYTDEQIEKVCELLQDGGFTNKEIAKLTGVSTAMVSMVKIGKVRCQQSEKYKWKTIKFEDKKGENHNMVKINKKIVIEICELLSQGMSSKNIAEELGAPVTKAIVNNIKFRKSWTDVSKDYEWDVDHSKAHNKGKNRSK